MKNLSLDLETFSDVDLAKCGVYRYCESPNFDILLFGYSVDEGPVQVVDLASGEIIPEEILAALADNRVTKWAHNAAFERICLSRYLHTRYPEYFSSYSIQQDSVGDYLDPRGWRCSMVWAAYMGLPLSLKDVGTILKLEDQKLEEGKDLVKYFCAPCRPTKSNGERTRNMPWDDQEKWELFKKYNLRDVEVEQAIRTRLAKHPVPEQVWDEYHLSEEINDRGIRVDMKLVESALQMDAKSKEELTAAMKKLTDLDNPNSVQQMKEWLVDKGVEVDTLGKKAVAAMLKDVPPELRDVLVLRQQLAKSSVKKYQAMRDCVCADGRARGMFFFYGAPRTGRWCLTGDHEVLTPEGWVQLDTWQGGSIACWNASSHALSFQMAEQLSFDYDGPMYTYKDARIDQCSTPDHKMYAKKRYDEPWHDMTVQEMAACRPSIPMNGYHYHRGCANPAWLRVLIMTQADGYYTADGAIRFHFKKERKIERCKHLLRKAEIPFAELPAKDTTCITIPSRGVPLWLREFRSKVFGYWLLDENPDIFFDELPNWDGYCPAPNSIQYSTCCRQNADIVQALAHLSGRCANIRVKKHSSMKENWSDAYVVDIWLTPGESHEIRVKPTVTQYNGKVYCASTQTGYFLVRRGGKVWITGNSGRHIQLQNLPQNHIEDLEDARALVRNGDYSAVKMLYGDVPDTLSQLIRTTLIPQTGMKFVVADFSAIEARVLSFLAGEQWRLDVFESGGDIYCQSASQMFKVPVEKHGVNGHLRQKGKIAELACIAEDSLVLTDSGLVPIQNVTKDMLVWDGENWVPHDGVVYRGEREVITYEGLTATPDHLVWIKGQSEPVQFGIAATSCAHLVQSGNGRNPIRLGENHISGEEMEQENESLLCPDKVHGVRSNSVADSGKSYTRDFKRMPNMFSAKTDSQMAGQTIDSCKTALRESVKQGIQELWCKGHKIRVSECNGSRALYDKGTGTPGAEDGDRQDRYKWELCSGQSAVCKSQNELHQSAQMRPFGIFSGILALFVSGCNPKTVTRPDTRRNNIGCPDGCFRKTEKLETHQRTARLYDIRNAGPFHRFTVSNSLVHNCGYGGGVGALKAMGALDMGLTEAELQPLVSSWREANPRIVKFWWEVDRAVKDAVMRHIDGEVNGIGFSCRSGVLSIKLPSGRQLNYVKPRMGINQFGGDAVTYEGTGTAKKWERIESYGPKFVENIVQAVSRDILASAMCTLSHCFIVAHVHDELIIECDPRVSVDAVCQQMGRTPPWIEGLCLRADGYETEFYKKD